MRPTRLPLVFALLACGPGAGGSSDAETGSSSDDPTSTTDTPGTSTPSTSSSTTPGTTIDPTTEVTSTSDPTTGSTSETQTTGPIEDCSLFEQNCPDGQKCMPYANDGSNSWNATRCVPIDPDPDALGEPCTVEDNGVSGIDSCDGTSFCFGVDPDTLQGTCYAFCGGDAQDPTCPNACDHCSITGDGVLTICLPTCDPLAPDCQAGEGCVSVSSGESGFVCVPLMEEPAAPGEVCEYVNDCEAGSVCLDASYLPACEGAACCTPLCSVDDPEPCAPVPGTECASWFEEPPRTCIPQELGVCVTPR